MKKFLFVLVMMSGAISWAGPQVTPASKNFAEKLEKFTADYLLQLHRWEAPSLAMAAMGLRGRDRRNCDDRDRPGPRGSGCFEAVCNQMDAYDCDDQSEIEAVMKMCRGVRGSCVENVCKRMDSYDCDDMSELQEVTDMCRDVFRGDCVEAFCSRMDNYDCDDMSELKRVAKACHGEVSASCIEAICSRMDRYDCDDIGELERVAQSCSGRN